MYIYFSVFSSFFLLLFFNSFCWREFGDILHQQVSQKLLTHTSFIGEENKLCQHSSSSGKTDNGELSSWKRYKESLLHTLSLISTYLRRIYRTWFASLLVFISLGCFDLVSSVLKSPKNLSWPYTFRNTLL